MAQHSYKEFCSCWLTFVIYAESFTLGVTNKTIMLSVIILNSVILSVIIMNVIMLSALTSPQAWLSNKTSLGIMSFGPKVVALSIPGWSNTLKEKSGIIIYDGVNEWNQKHSTSENNFIGGKTFRQIGILPLWQPIKTILSLTHTHTHTHIYI